MMTPMKDWLARKPKGPAPRRPLPKVKAKRLGENAYYLKRRAAFLSRFHACACSMALFGCHQNATEIHHTAGRIGKNFLDESTWLPMSRDAHTWIHQHPSEARAKGWLK